MVNHKIVVLMLIIMAIVAACGGGTEAESSPPSESNTSNVAQSRDNTIEASHSNAQIKNPFSESDYENFNLSHAITLCEGVIVPFPAAWNIGLYSGQFDEPERCFFEFANDDRITNPKDAGKTLFRAWVSPYAERVFINLEDVSTFRDMTPAEIFTEGFFSQSLLGNDTNPVEELTINNRPAMRYEVVGKYNADDPEAAKILYIIDVSQNEQPIYAVLLVEMLAGELEDWRPIVEEWANSINNNSVMEQLDYVYALPMLTASLPESLEVDDSLAKFSLETERDADEDPLLLTVEVGNNSLTPDLPTHTFTFLIPEVPPVDGKEYKLISQRDGDNQVEFRSRYSVPDVSWFNTWVREATITLSYDGYVMTASVNGTFIITERNDIAPPIVDEFSISMTFTNIPVFPNF